MFSCAGICRRCLRRCRIRQVLHRPGGQQQPDMHGGRDGDEIVQKVVVGEACPPARGGKTQTTPS